MENKLASSLLASLGKAHNGTLSPVCGREVAGRVSNHKNKKADYCCGDPKLGIKPATSYINGNKARKKRELCCVLYAKKLDSF